MKLKWHADAAAELDEAALYYGTIDDDLGDRFVAAAEVAVAEMKANPRLARTFDGRARKVRFKRFPMPLSFGLNPAVYTLLPSCTCVASPVIGAIA